MVSNNKEKITQIRKDHCVLIDNKVSISPYLLSKQALWFL